MYTTALSGSLSCRSVCGREQHETSSAMMKSSTVKCSYKNLAWMLTIMMAAACTMHAAGQQAPPVQLSAKAAMAQQPVAQGTSQSSWEADAGGKMAFDVVSVRQNKSDTPPSSNVPLDPGTAYPPNGGLLSVTNTPLISYIAFAYKLNLYQMRALDQQLPKWASSAKYDVQARTSDKVTKDQMRLMMQSMLADRFHLTMHRESKDMRVYGLVLVKAGKTGPALQPHPAGEACTPPPLQGHICSTCTLVGSTSSRISGDPRPCGGLGKFPSANPGEGKVGGRALTMQFIANSLAGIGRLDRPVKDETGLSGLYDFMIEFAPTVYAPPQPGTAPPEQSGPTFIEALRSQLGLDLKSQVQPSTVLVLDHIDPLIEN